MVGFVALTLLLTRGPFRALLAAAGPAAVYLVWFAAFGHDGRAQAPDASVADVLRFAHTGLAGLWQAVLRVPHLGGVFLVALTAAALVVPAGPRARRLALAGVLACVITYLLLGHSRAGLGPQAALASRYSYFGLLMTLPAFAVVLGAALTWLRPRVPLALRAALVGGLTAAFAVSGTLQTVSYADARVQLAPGLEQRVLGARALVAEQAPLLSAQVEPRYNGDITAGSLADPAIARRLSSERPTPRGLLDASAALQVGVSTTDLGLAPAQSVTLHDLAGELPEAGCAELKAGRDARVDVAPAPGGVQVSVTPNRDRLRTTLVDGRTRSLERTDKVARGEPTYVGNVSGATLELRLQPGTVTLCR